MLKFVVHPATRGYVDSQVLCSCWRPCWYQSSVLSLKAMRMSVIFADTRNYMNVCWSCYHQRPCYCPWFVLPRAMMLSVVVHADAGNHVDFYDLNCCQKLWESPWSMMLLIVEDKEDSFSVASITANSQLRAGDIEGFCVVGYLSTMWGSTIVIGVIENWMTNTWEAHDFQEDRELW